MENKTNRGVIIMSKTINFYNVAIFKNDEKTNIDFLKFIDTIGMVSWENRVRKIDDDITSMFPLLFNDLHTEKRIVPFGKFRRDYKPFVGDITTSKLKSIKNDVVEMVTMVYDQDYKCAAIDYNMYGLKQKGIENYLTSFLPKKQNEIWEVKLEPIIIEKGIENISKSQQIKLIEIKIRTNGNNRNILKNDIKQEYKYITELFNSAKKTSQDIEANTIKIQLGIGNLKNATMDINAVKYILGILNIDNQALESIKVRYKDDSTEKLDTIDLKNIGKQLKDKILEDNEDSNPAPEFIGNTIIELYGTYDKTLSQQYYDFIEEMVSEKFPKLQTIPREENQLEEEQ